MSYWYDQLVVGGVGGGVPSVLRFLIKSKFSMKFSLESLQICYMDSL